MTGCTAEPLAPVRDVQARKAGFCEPLRRLGVPPYERTMTRISLFIQFCMHHPSPKQWGLWWRLAGLTAELRSKRKRQEK